MKNRAGMRTVLVRAGVLCMKGVIFLNGSQI